SMSAAYTRDSMRSIWVSQLAIAAGAASTPAIAIASVFIVDLLGLSSTRFLRVWCAPCYRRETGKAAARRDAIGGVWSLQGCRSVCAAGVEPTVNPTGQEGAVAA